MRPLNELIDQQDPGWPVVQGWIREAKNQYEVLDRDPEKSKKVLLAIQVTTRSPMGAIAYETGGLLIDHGWLRILGSGNPKLPRDIASWNRLDPPGEPWFPQMEIQAPDGSVNKIPGAILIADDAVGGFYLVNGGIFPVKPGDVIYLPPDALEWYHTKLGYSQFVHWALTGDLETFYNNCRWTGWKDDCASLSGDRTFSFYPPLWAKHSSIDERSRRDVPVDEALGLYLHMRAQLAAQQNEIGNNPGQ